jgi:hypothetical protein
MTERLWVKIPHRKEIFVHFVTHVYLHLSYVSFVSGYLNKTIEEEYYLR